MKGLLWMRMLIANVAVLVAYAWAYLTGYIPIAYAADSSGICIVITGVGIFALISIDKRAVTVSRMLNRLNDGELVSVNGRKMLAKQAWLADLGRLCQSLGFLGTVLGLLMAFMNLDLTGDPKSILTHLIAGIGTALLTTAAGIIASETIWFHCRALHTATISLIEDADANG